MEIIIEKQAQATENEAKQAENIAPSVSPSLRLIKKARRIYYGIFNKEVLILS